MGRSQVLYNRRHRRHAKRRNRETGEAKEAKDSAAETHARSTSSIEEKQQQTSKRRNKEGDLALFELEANRLVVPSPSPTTEEDIQRTSLDVRAMGMALETLPLHELYQIPSHLLVAAGLQDDEQSKPSKLVKKNESLNQGSDDQELHYWLDDVIS